MARIAPVSTENPPPDLAAAFNMDLEREGVVLNTTRIAGHLPSVLLATKQLGRAIAQSGHVQAQLRMLMSARVARLVGCPF